jgi:hypothetical protein
MAKPKTAKDPVPLEPKPAVPSQASFSFKQERRDNRRYHTDDMAVVEIPPNRVLEAYIRDVSRTGIRLEVSEMVELGTAVRVKLPRNVIVFGDVRRVQRSADCFYIGVEIDQLHCPDEGMEGYPPTGDASDQEPR